MNGNAITNPPIRQTVNTQDARDIIKVLGDAGIVSYTLDEALVKHAATVLGITVPKEKGNFLFFVPRRNAAYVIISPRHACERDKGVRWLAMRFDFERYEASGVSKTQCLEVGLYLFRLAVERIAGFAGGERKPLDQLEMKN